jgi:hypothetical protein
VIAKAFQLACGRGRTADQLTVPPRAGDVTANALLPTRTRSRGLGCEGLASGRSALSTVGPRERRHTELSCFTSVTSECETSDKSEERGQGSFWKEILLTPPFLSLSHVSTHESCPARAAAMGMGHGRGRQPGRAGGGALCGGQRSQIIRAIRLYRTHDRTVLGCDVSNLKYYQLKTHLKTQFSFPVVNIRTHSISVGRALRSGTSSRARARARTCISAPRSCAPAPYRAQSRPLIAWLSGARPHDTLLSVLSLAAQPRSRARQRAPPPSARHVQRIRSPLGLTIRPAPHRASSRHTPLRSLGPR